MLDKFLALLERFVVAHELIAANSSKPVVGIDAEKAAELTKKVSKVVSEAMKDVPVEGEDVIDTKPAKKADQVEVNLVEDDLTDDEPEEKPKTRKPRTAKAKVEPEPDLDKLREEIEVMAKHIGSGDSDDCADELDDLLDEYDARSVKRIEDDEVVDFHKQLKAIVAKYYDIEE